MTGQQGDCCCNHAKGNRFGVRSQILQDSSVTESACCGVHDQSQNQLVEGKGDSDTTHVQHPSDPGRSS